MYCLALRNAIVYRLPAWQSWSLRSKILGFPDDCGTFFKPYRLTITTKKNKLPMFLFIWRNIYIFCQVCLSLIIRKNTWEITQICFWLLPQWRIKVETPILLFLLFQDMKLFLHMKHKLYSKIIPTATLP